MRTPLAIDLFCGLGGWTAPLLDEGWDVVGFDNERHVYGEHRYPGLLVIQDVRTLHGSQFRDADLIVASPPCQKYSYMAMPWTRAKKLAEWYRDSAHPERIRELNELFDACFRIQREACEAAGRHIPLIVENVRGAQPWVGRARWNYGSYYLWGDVPALMPSVSRRSVLKPQPYQRRHGTGSWFAIDMKSARAGVTDPKEVTRVAGAQAVKGDGVKQGGNWFHDSSPGTLRSYSGSAAYKSTGLNWSDRSRRGQDFTRVAGAQAVKQPGLSEARENGKGDRWFQDGTAQHGSKSPARKMASALIAKIPYDLARHIAVTLRPDIYAERVRSGDIP
jgi:hypothetical protein